MELKDQFRCKTPELCSQVSMKTLYTDYNIGNMKDQDFEFIVLESALENIINKFKKLNFPQYFSFLIVVYNDKVGSRQGRRKKQ